MQEVDGYSDARVEYNTDKPSMIPVRLSDTTRAEKVQSFKAKTGLPEGIRKNIEWYRENRTQDRFVTAMRLEIYGR